MKQFYRITETGILLDIKAVPGASKTEFAGFTDSRVRIRIAAAPEDGKANIKLIEFLARFLGCPKRELRIINGEKSRLKTISLPIAYREKIEKINSRCGFVPDLLPYKDSCPQQE